MIPPVPMRLDLAARFCKATSVSYSEGDNAWLVGVQGGYRPPAWVLVYPHEIPFVTGERLRERLELAR